MSLKPFTIIALVIIAIWFATKSVREENIAYSAKCKAANGVMMDKPRVCVKPDSIIEMDQHEIQ